MKSFTRKPASEQDHKEVSFWKSFKVGDWLKHMIGELEKSTICDYFIFNVSTNETQNHWYKLNYWSYTS